MEAINSPAISAIYQSDYFLQVSASAKTANENMKIQKTKMDSLSQNMDEILISYPKSCSNSFYDLERQYRNCSKDHHEASLLHNYYSQTVDDAKSLIEKIAVHTSLKCCGIRSAIPFPSPYRNFPLSRSKALGTTNPRNKDWNDLVEEERRSAKIQ